MRNKNTIEKKIISLSRYLNLSDISFDNFITWIIDFRKKLEIPHTLKELIKEDNQLEKMSQMALDDPSTSTNPITLKKDDFLKLYIDSYNGKL